MTKTAIALIASVIFCVSCAERKAEPIELATGCKLENEKKYVQVSGFLSDQGSIFCSNIGGGRMDCGFALLQTPDAKEGLKSDIAEGTGANSVEKFEGSYTKDTLKIHDNSGGLVKLGDKVTLTGEMNVTPDGKFCYLEVDKIEK